jgi:pimeloyl-ACP methyl ester carboxylesterase
VQESVTFPGGADDVTLDGTLTLPPGAGPHPAVVLVSGSGAQDRDETIAGTSMKPFALLADALTRAGVAVLRYDDRGVGRSTGDFASAITEDFTEDALAAIAFLEARPDINPDQVGVLGHSEGGMVAAQLGAQNAVDFIISLAGTSVPGTDLLMVQNRLVMEAEGMAEAEIEAQLSLLTALFPLVIRDDRDAIEQVVTDYAADYYASLSPEMQATYGSVEQYTELLGQTLMAQFAPPWMRNFLQLNPAEDWAQTTAPVLALFGDKDVQVDAEQNAGPLEAALAEAGNTDVTIVTLAGANHLFQAANTGAVSEYASLPGEFTPELIPTILDWLLARVTVAE